jgi:PKD repeat protein
VAGTYTAQLTVSNIFGSSSATKQVNVIPPAPVASFNTTPSPATGTAPLTVTFTDTSTGGAPTSWNWSFGDGTYSNFQNPPAQTYAVAGSYTAQLTVSNAGGSSFATAPVSVGIPAPMVTSIAPNTGLNTTTISITNLAGNYFITGATVKLNRTGYADIPGTILTLSSTQITCTFDLTNKKTGLWNVAVTNPDGKSGVLPNGFTITAPRIQFYYEGFESGSTGWVITAGSRQNSVGIPKNQTWVMRLRSTNNMYRPTSTAGYNNIIVEFAWALTSNAAGENAYAEYSTNGGTSWAPLSQINGPVNQLSLNIFTSPLLPPSADNNANFQLRFRITGSTTADILYVDDVSVTGVPI